VTQVFQQAFDDAIKSQQTASPSRLRWKSGLAKSIYNLDEEGGIKDRLCADYTIYGPLNEPYLAVEIAYSQTLESVNEKVAHWMSIPSVVGVIVVKIQESPVFKRPEKRSGPHRRLTKEEWSKELASCPPFGPLNANGLNWAGEHQVTVAVHRRCEELIEQVK
jgi:hypothetical protein